MYTHTQKYIFRVGGKNRVGRVKLIKQFFMPYRPPACGWVGPYYIPRRSPSMKKDSCPFACWFGSIWQFIHISEHGTGCITCKGKVTEHYNIVVTELELEVVTYHLTWASCQHMWYVCVISFYNLSTDIVNRIIF